MAASKITGRPVSVYLTGFMGSGKTEVGRSLAQQLGWEFADLDHRIEKKGRAIHEIFAAEGEAAFRRLETAALAELLAESSVRQVVALGGGAFCQDANVRMIRLARQPVVFLDAPADELWRRCQEHGSEVIRPLLEDRNRFAELYQQRRPYYEAADFTVQTSGKSADGTAREIEQWLRQNSLVN